MIADGHCDIVRQHASGPRNARSSAGLWDSETCALFIRGSKFMSRMKERLTQQLLDRDLRAYLEKKEQWSAQHFESIEWTNYSSAFNILSKGWKTAVAKATHNLWHTGTRHQQYFGDAKPCCMCNCETEDWRHVLTCGSIDASFHRAESWVNSKSRWSGGIYPHTYGRRYRRALPTTRNNHTNAKYTRKTMNHKNRSELHSTPQVTCSRMHSGHNIRDWITYVRHNDAHSNGHGKSNDLSAKFTGGLWEHLKRLWQFWNDIYHQDNEGTIARYKLESLERNG
jgi:hypothetical protein